MGLSNIVGLALLSASKNTTLRNPESTKLQSRGFNQLQAPADEGFRNPGRVLYETTFREADLPNATGMPNEFRTIIKSSERERRENANRN
jgi:hypothetical protein